MDSSTDALTPTARSAGHVVAWALTELFTPAVSVIAISVFCGVYGAPGAEGWAWGLALGAFCGLIPYVALEIASRRKRITNRHVTEHSERPWAYMVCFASVAAGFITMAVLGAPALLIWALCTMTFGLVVTGGVTMVGPKVSMHAFCLTSFAVTAAILSSPWWLLLLCTALPAVVWSRLRLGHHSPVEVVTGTALAFLVVGVASVFMP